MTHVVLGSQGLAVDDEKHWQHNHTYICLWQPANKLSFRTLSALVKKKPDGPSLFNVDPAV